jgi:hypothetical protein
MDANHPNDRGHRDAIREAIADGRKLARSAEPHPPQERGHGLVAVTLPVFTGRTFEARS